MPKAELSFAVYLAFNGNCRQAFSYYQTCFGGELTLHTLGDTPFGDEMSREMREAVVTATLQNEYFRLVGTDLTDKGKIVSGNNVSILIGCGSFGERAKLINKLAGRNFCSLANTNSLIGFKDKYGVQWILSAGEQHA